MKNLIPQVGVQFNAIHHSIAQILKSKASIHICILGSDQRGSLASIAGSTTQLTPL